MLIIKQIPWGKNAFRKTITELNYWNKDVTSVLYGFSEIDRHWFLQSSFAVISTDFSSTSHGCACFGFLVFFQATARRRRAAPSFMTDVHHTFSIWLKPPVPGTTFHIYSHTQTSVWNRSTSWSTSKTKTIRSSRKCVHGFRAPKHHRIPHWSKP